MVGSRKSKEAASTCDNIARLPEELLSAAISRTTPLLCYLLASPLY
jgi:hypothetical protein